jgi:ATP-dependent RNA helicase DeaD
LSNFSNLGLSESINKVLPELGILIPTPIQQQSIPILVNEKRDFIGMAQTGTGKTAAFGLPLIDKIDTSLSHTQALVLAPTRELCLQIAQNISAFSKYHRKIRVQAVYGGASIVQQMRELKNTPQIIIATPGRLIDMIDRKKIELGKIEIVVLDEADEMLNMGFKEDIDKILSYTPSDKITWLFSATMPPEIRAIVKKYMTNPAEVAVNTTQKINENIEHRYVVVKQSDKLECLKRFLDIEKDIKGIVFCRTKSDTQELSEKLSSEGYKIDALHGDMSQSQREKVMRRFKSHSLNVVCATDVAARGIDVNDLTHVIHFALPDDITYYTHRSGRTARAGKKGISLCILTSRDTGKVRMMEKRLGVTFNKAEVPKAIDLHMNLITKWYKKINDTKLKEKDEYASLISEAVSAFENISKEELIAKLVTLELGKIKVSAFDINHHEEKGHSGRKNDFSDDRGSKKNRNGENRFFINIGSMDDVTKMDLLDFISSQCNMNKKEINNVSLLKNCSFFNVGEEYTDTVISTLNGLVVDGRKLRVNKDDFRPENNFRSREKKNNFRPDNRRSRIKRKK